MRKLSGSILMYKEILPFIVISFIANYLIFFVSGIYRTEILALIVPGFVMTVFIVLYKTKLCDLSDEVIDYGDYLLFKKGDLSQLVDFSEIKHIYSEKGKPERISIVLKQKGVLGSRLVFAVPARIFQNTENPIAVELRERTKSNNLK